jgi:protein-L-isoaspartate(D-aspartate) O-methyltransferase
MQHKKALRALVDSLKKRGDLLDARLEAAFLAVPRHIFLPGVDVEQAYADEAVPIKRTMDGAVISSSSQPSMMALMIRQLNLKPGDNVLEIGAGSGYNAAVMQQLVGDAGKITSLELDRDLANQAMDHLARAHASNVQVVHGDGAQGYAPRAAYDHIIATAGIWDVPPAWVKQLRDEGTIVGPIWVDGIQISAAFRRQENEVLYSEDNVPCGFVPLRGVAAGPVVTSRITSSDLTLAAESVDHIDTASLHVLLSSDHEECYLGAALSSGDYWHGFLPYLMLNTPTGYIFVTYSLNRQSYGMEGSGFALITQGSACFVPFNGSGNAHCYAGADAYMVMQDTAEAWMKAGQPRTDKLRLALIPKGDQPLVLTHGKVYTRRDHYLHVWLEQ